MEGKSATRGEVKMLRFNLDFFIRTFFLALRGIPVTMAITIVSLAIATPLAFCIAMSKLHSIPVAKQISTFYISFVQGTPAVVQVMLVYSLVPSLLAAFVKRFGIGIDVFDTNPIVYAYVIFSLNTTAVLSEAFRSALLTVDRGQLEAAYSVGMSPFKAYTRIILPQALVVALPNICNITVSLIKNTSLAFMMTVKEITAIVKIEAAYGFNYIEGYLDIWIIYILLCSGIEAVFKLAERLLSEFRGGSMRQLQKKAVS
jgi:L-cystine transport system permease protein